MFYVVPQDHSFRKCLLITDSKEVAIRRAESLHEKTGNHYDVMSFGCVHTTQTLAELLEQDAILAAEDAAWDAAWAAAWDAAVWDDAAGNAASKT